MGILSRGDVIINILIKFLKNIVNQYELKHPQYETPVYICTHIDTRNRYKNDEYKIPDDQPQCPIYKDNRCCGGCKLAAKCEHCVDCGCFGFTYGQMGGTDKGYYLHKASKYYGIGRLDNNCKFDWNYYYIQRKRRDIKIGKFIIVDNQVYEIKSKPNRNGKFKAVDDNGIWTRFDVYQMENYVSVYNDKYAASMSLTRIV